MANTNSYEKLIADNKRLTAENNKFKRKFVDPNEKMEGESFTDACARRVELLADTEDDQKAIEAMLDKITGEIKNIVPMLNVSKMVKGLQVKKWPVKNTATCQKFNLGSCARFPVHKDVQAKVYGHWCWCCINYLGSCFYHPITDCALFKMIDEKELLNMADDYTEGPTAPKQQALGAPAPVPAPAPASNSASEDFSDPMNNPGPSNVDPSTLNLKNCTISNTSNPESDAEMPIAPHLRAKRK